MAKRRRVQNDEKAPGEEKEEEGKKDEVEKLEEPEEKEVEVEGAEVWLNDDEEEEVDISMFDHIRPIVFQYASSHYVPRVITIPGFGRFVY